MTSLREQLNNDFSLLLDLPESYLKKYPDMIFRIKLQHEYPFAEYMRKHTSLVYECYQYYLAQLDACIESNTPFTDWRKNLAFNFSEPLTDKQALQMELQPLLLDNFILSDDSGFLDDLVIDDYENIQDLEDEDFDFLPNQLKVFEHIDQYGFESGVVFQYMGSGKTAIFLHIIQKHYNKFKGKGLYIVSCERKEILQDIIISESELTFADQAKGRRPINQKIINASDFNVLNYVRSQLTQRDVKLHPHKPTLLIINNASLKLLKNKLETSQFEMAMQLLIVDECHSSGAKGNYDFLKQIFHDRSIPMMGFSATPVRKSKVVKSRIATLYGDGESINFIGTYTLIDSIKDGISLPFKYYMVPKSSCEGPDGWLKVKDVIEKVSDTLPYRKFLVWCRNMNECENYYNTLGLSLKDNFSLFLSHSRAHLISESPQGLISSYENIGMRTDKFVDNIPAFNLVESDAILFCVNQGREGCNIKNLDCGIYLEGYKNKGVIVRLQSSGRVNRKADNKKYATIIELVHDDNQDSIYSKIISDIVELYNYTLQSHNIDMNEIDKAFDFMSFVDGIKFENGDIITDAFVFSGEFLPVIDFESIKQDIRKIELDRLKKNKEKYFEYCLKVMKCIWGFGLRTRFVEAYDSMPDKRGLPNSFEEFYSTFKEFMEKKSLYNWLELDTRKWISHKTLCKEYLKEKGVKITCENDYFEACKHDDRLPWEPAVFYSHQSFEGIVKEFKETCSRLKGIL